MPMMRGFITAAVFAVVSIAAVWFSLDRQEPTDLAAGGDAVLRRPPESSGNTGHFEVNDAAPAPAQRIPRSEASQQVVPAVQSNVAALGIMAGAAPLAARFVQLDVALDSQVHALNTFKASSVFACQMLNDAGLQSAAEEDGTKAWALHEWKRQCEGLGTPEFKAAPIGEIAKSQQLLGLINSGDHENASRVAHEAIADALTPTDIQLAITALLETGKLDFKSFSPNFQFVPHEEQLSAIAISSQLVLCARGGGCGPHSLPTAVFCAQRGCRPGSDYERAINSALAQRELELVRSLYAWLNARVAIGQR